MNDVCGDTHTGIATSSWRAPLVSFLALVATLCGSACSREATSPDAPRAGAEASLDDDDAHHDDRDGEGGNAVGGSGGDREPTPEIEPDWCAARRVLEAKCQRCHGAAPEHGAPFPLTSYDDTQVLSARGKPRFVAIESAVSTDFMPATFIELEPPVEPLSEPERAVLLRWCSLGAPPAPSGDCEP
jgi:hypothetical protein